MPALHSPGSRRHTLMNETPPDARILQKALDQNLESEQPWEAARYTVVSNGGFARDHRLFCSLRPSPSLALHAFFQLAPCVHLWRSYGSFLGSFCRQHLVRIGGAYCASGHPAREWHFAVVVRRVGPHSRFSEFPAGQAAQRQPRISKKSGSVISS